MNFKFDFNVPSWILLFWAVHILLNYGGDLYDITGFIMQATAIGVLCFLVQGNNCRIKSMGEENGNDKQ